MAATEGLAGTEGLVRAPKGYYKVETAPSGRSACQACHSTIDYGELRLGVMIENPSYPGWWKYRWELRSWLLYCHARPTACISHPPRPRAARPLVLLPAHLPNPHPPGTGGFMLRALAGRVGWAG